MVNTTNRLDSSITVDQAIKKQDARFRALTIHLPRWLMAVLLGVFTIIILTATSPEIGLTWDEPIYMEASESYISWYGLLARQPALAMQDQTIRQYWETYHTTPPFDEIWSGLFWRATRGFLDDITAHRFGNILISAILVSLLYLLLAKNYGNLAGLAAAFALLTLPRFFFHAHLAALDVPVSAMIFFVCFAFWETRSSFSIKWTLLLGFLFGLAISTKINGLIELPIILLAWVLSFQPTRAMFIRLAAMGGIGLAFFFLLWPWLYHDTVQRALGYILFMTVNHYPIAQWYHYAIYMPPPWHYPLVILLLVLPVTITFFGTAGAVDVLSKEFKDHLAWLFIIATVFPISLEVFHFISAYDGERLLMPVFPFIAAFAGIGFALGIRALERISARWLHAHGVAVLSLLMALVMFSPQVITSFVLYPHLLSYYSEGVGLLPGAYRLGFERTYWAETYAAALPFLNTNTRPGAVVWVEAHDVMLYYQHLGLLRKDIRIASNHGSEGIVKGEQGQTASIQNADYAVIEFRESGLTNEVKEWISKRKAQYSISYNNVPLMSIYAR